MPIIDLRKHQFTKGDEIFLDANVLIYVMQKQLFQENDKPDYFKFIKKALNLGAIPFVNAMVMSEFINSWIRRRCRDENIEYNKGTRGSKEVKKITSEVCLYALDLLKPKLLTFKDEKLSLEEVKDVLHSMEQGEADFNDLMIQAMCRKHNFYVMTHDADYGDSDLRVLTLHPKLTHKSLKTASPNPIKTPF